MKKEFVKFIGAYSILYASIICSIIAAVTITIHGIKTLLPLFSQQCAWIAIVETFGMLFLISLVFSIVLCGLINIILGYIYNEFYS